MLWSAVVFCAIAFVWEGSYLGGGVRFPYTYIQLLSSARISSGDLCGSVLFLPRFYTAYLARFAYPGVQPIFAGLFSVRLSRRRSGASPPSFVGGAPAPRPSLVSSKFRTSQRSSRVVPHDFGCPNMYISAFGFLSSRVFWVCFGLDQLIKTAN